MLCLLCLSVLVLSNHLPYCVAQHPRDRVVSVLNPTCLLCLHLSLTPLAGSYACWSAARVQSLLCDYTTDVPLPALHEAIRALSDTAGTTPSHLCDTWRWLTLEGELYAVSDLRVMLTTSGALLSVTANMKTTTGVQVVTYCQVAMAQPLPLLAFAQTADATSRGLLLRRNPYFQRIHGNWFRARLRQLLGLTEADQSPEFRGTQYSKLVTDPISQRLPPQLRSDGAGQWAVILDMPTRPLNTPHVTPDVLHQIYPYVLWWAADLVATPQQEFPVGSPANVKTCKISAEQAPRVLEASTLLLRDEEVAGEVMDLAPPPWAPASILALLLASGLRDPMSMCSAHEVLRTPRLPELSLAVWTEARDVATPAELGGVLVDDALSPPPTSSAARTTKEVQDKLVDGDSVPIDLLS